jgi:hypothetical protein
VIDGALTRTANLQERKRIYEPRALGTNLPAATKVTLRSRSLCLCGLIERLAVRETCNSGNMRPDQESTP